MREIRPSGSEGGGTEINRSSLPLSTLAIRQAFYPNPFFHSSYSLITSSREHLGR